MFSLTKPLLGIALTFLTLPVFAVPFTNGDFTSGLSSWNDASGSGSVLVSGGVSQLETGSGVDSFSSVLVQGDDGFFNFLSPVSLAASDRFLSFDVQFLDLGVDSSELVAGILTDSLGVNLYDALDFNLDLLGIVSGIDSSLSGWTHFDVDISSLSGRDVALSFELADVTDGRDSRVYIDNIAFGDSINTVPEPNISFLFMMGLFFLSAMRVFRCYRRC